MNEYQKRPAVTQENFIMSKTMIGVMTVEMTAVVTAVVTCGNDGGNDNEKHQLRELNCPRPTLKLASCLQANDKDVPRGSFSETPLVPELHESTLLTAVARDVMAEASVLSTSTSNTTHALISGGVSNLQKRMSTFASILQEQDCPVPG